MNIFVYRDVMFELMEYSGTYIMFSELGGGRAVIQGWGRKPTLEEVRTKADEHVTHLVLEAKRAGGDVVCPVCKEEYKSHPSFRGAFFMEHAYLTRLCGGELVKL